ncbi:TIGR02301 family protein [Bartonella sp. CB178]|uniref:TIGR02301 family protein n=1 Tax=Bartonella sp. CB178 TaxID=3112255 RepID=UPI00300E15AA
MRKMLISVTILTFLLTTTPTFSQHRPLYDTKLLRLAEILGSLHYLQNLCGIPTNRWHNYMKTLIETEKPAPKRLAYFYQAFNEAYRAFSESYHDCTQSAAEASQRYIKEGRILSENLLLNPRN